uniref:Uncharacterized protein n=1 Tax=Arundo donax TaxID=35708 RepID=A0A0A9CT38_ARUDO
MGRLARLGCATETARSIAYEKQYVLVPSASSMFACVVLIVMSCCLVLVSFVVVHNLWMLKLRACVSFVLF